MQLDDLLKVTFDGEVWIQIQVCTLPNGRQDTDIRRTGSRNWPGILGQGPQETAVLVFILGQKARNPLVLLGILFLPETKSSGVSGSWSCLLLTSFCFAFPEG